MKEKNLDEKTGIRAWTYVLSSVLIGYITSTFEFKQLERKLKIRGKLSFFVNVNMSKK